MVRLFFLPVTLLFLFNGGSEIKVFTKIFAHKEKNKTTTETEGQP